MPDEAAPQVIEVRKDVQTRQVKGGHVVILTTRTYYDNGSNATSQEDAVAETGAKTAELISAFLAS